MAVPQPGANFQVTGGVAPSFLSSVQQARDLTAQATASQRTWKDIIASTGGTLLSAGKTLAAYAIEQKRHHAQTQAITDATTKQLAVYQKLQTEALAPLTQQLAGLVQVQERQLAVMQAQQSAAVGQAQSLTQTAAATGQLNSGLQANSFQLDTFRSAAQSAFSGDLKGSVSQLSSTISAQAGPILAVTAAVGLLNEGLKLYEDAEKKAGKAIEDESKRLAKVTTQWREYGAAIESASGKSSGFANAPRTWDPKALLGNLNQIRGNVQKIIPVDAYAEFEKDKKKSTDDPVIAKLEADLKAAQDAKDRIQPTVSRLRSLRGGKTHFSSGEPDAEGMASALGKSDLIEQAKATGSVIPIKFTASELEQAIRGQEALYKEFEQSQVALTEYGKKVKVAADALEFLSTKKDKVKEVATALGELKTRQGLVEGKRFASEALDSAKGEYTKATGGKTDELALTKVVTGSGYSKIERDLAKNLLDLRKAYLDQEKAIADFDDAAAKKSIEAGRKKVANLEEELALRKAEGRSSWKDVATTIDAELAAVDPKDKATKTHLLNRRTEEHGKFLEEDYKSQVEGAKDAYKELAATGTATSEQLAAANRKIANAAAQWKAENSGVLDQFPKLKAEVESLLSSTRAEGGRIQGKAFDEHFRDLKQTIGDGANAALTLQDRLAANQRAVEQTNEAYRSGLITQKQYQEELGTLEKERAGYQRTITQEMEAQKKAVSELKGKVAAQELSGLKYQVAAGRGGIRPQEQEEQLQGQEIRAKLDAIEQEYQAAVKGGKDQVLAAEEASLKKKLIWEQEADAFAKSEDAKTAAQKSAEKNRLGGSASPLVGLGEGVGSSGFEFSGFGNFGDNFGKFHRERSVYDTYKDAALPEAVQSEFTRHRSFEGLGAGKQAQSKAGDTYYMTANLEGAPGNVQDAAKTIAGWLADKTHQSGLTSGDAAPDMTKSQGHDWSSNGNSDGWQFGGK